MSKSIPKAHEATYRLFVALLILSAAALQAKPVAARVERFAILIGSNQGAAGEPDLQFAEKDAIKLHGVLKQLGDFRPENMVLQTGGDTDDARRAIISVNDRIRALDRNTSSLLLVYFSGHGDTNALHLGSSLFDLRELEQLVSGSSATTRLLIIDACRSGALTKVKGGRPVAPFQIAVDDSLAGEGVVFLTSATLGESAQESSELEASFFTHHLVSGLRGAADSNADGRVVLEEAYHHAYVFTLRDSSRTLAGVQHPTYHYDLRGRSGLVLTRISSTLKNRALVHFPRGYDFFLLRGDSQGEVVAEVTSMAQGRTLAVAPGHYFVRGRGRRVLLEGQLGLEQGDKHSIDLNTLRRVDYARLVRKGSNERSPALALEYGYWVRSPLWQNAKPCHGVHSGYRFSFRYLTLSPRLRACRSQFQNRYLTARSNELDLGLRAAYVFDLPIFSIDLGLGFGGALLQQGFTTPGHSPDRFSAAAHLDLGSDLTVDLPAHFYLAAGVEARTYLFSQWVTAEESVLATPLTFGGHFGIGKHF